MKILITGAAGFIGSHTAEALLKKRITIIGIDDLNNYYDPKIKKNNLATLNKYNNFTFYKADIRNKKTLETIFKKHKIDKVIHLAARAGVRPSIKDPQLYKDVNITGTMNLLDLAVKHKVKQFVFASSSSVYGKNKKIPFSETDIVDCPISPYAATKKAGELICYTYHHLHKLPVVCLRFFTVYGPRGRPDMTPYLFTKLISEGKTIERYGDDNVKRDFTYITDIVDGIVASLKIKKGYEIINLGNNNPVKLSYFISLIEKNIGKKAKIIRKPLPSGDVPITYADIRKASKILGYKPKVRIEEGIKKMVEWYLKENA